MIQTSPDFLSNHIKKGIVLDLKSEKYQIKKKIHHFRLTQREAIVKFEDIDSIQEAFRLIGYNVFSENIKKRASDNNSEDMVGFVVQDIQKRRWGIVKNISQHHMNEVIEVKAEDRSLLVPFHPNIIIKIDSDKKIITIDPPEGLEDLNK